MVAVRKEGYGRAIGGGVVAGIVGGLFISAVLVAMLVARGGDPWIAFKAAGAPFLGARAFQPGFDAMAVLVGALTHLAISIGWGVLFGLLFYGVPRSLTPLVGALWGLVAWFVMQRVALPLVGLGQMTRSTPLDIAVLQHLAFGLGVGLGFMPFQRHVRRFVRPRDTVPA